MSGMPAASFSSYPMYLLGPPYSRSEARSDGWNYYEWKAEQDHRERVKKHEEVTKRWFSLSYWAFGGAVGLSIWGLYELLH
jgi:hypothetical protein